MSQTYKSEPFASIDIHKVTDEHGWYLRGIMPTVNGSIAIETTHSNEPFEHKRDAAVINLMFHLTNILFNEGDRIIHDSQVKKIDPELLKYQTQPEESSQLLP